MRTTLTIDDSTARKLKQIAHETGKSYKQVANETLRRGLSVGKFCEQAKPYRLKPVSLGEVSPEYDLDKALALSGHVEDEEIVRELSLRG